MARDRSAAAADRQVKRLAQALNRRAALQVSRGQKPDAKFLQQVGQLVRAVSVREQRAGRWSRSNPPPKFPPWVDYKKRIRSTATVMDLAQQLRKAAAQVGKVAGSSPRKRTVNRRLRGMPIAEYRRITKRMEALYRAEERAYAAGHRADDRLDYEGKARAYQRSRDLSHARERWYLKRKLRGKRKPESPRAAFARVEKHYKALGQILERREYAAYDKGGDPKSDRIIRARARMRRRWPAVGMHRNPEGTAMTKLDRAAKAAGWRKMTAAEARIAARTMDIVDKMSPAQRRRRGITYRKLDQRLADEAIRDARAGKMPSKRAIEALTREGLAAVDAGWKPGDPVRPLPEDLGTRFGFSGTVQLRRMNPVSRARALARLEKLHQAVSRGLSRSKGPPSQRQIAIERAYQRALRMFESARRVNPVAKARRRKKSSSTTRRVRRSGATAQTSLPGIGGGTRRRKSGVRVPKGRPRDDGGLHDAHIKSWEASQPFDAHVQSFRTSTADKAFRKYRRDLLKRRRKYGAKAKRRAAARKGAATRKRGRSLKGVPAKLRKHPGLVKAWLKRHGRKGGGGSKRSVSGLRRWAMLSRGKRFSRKIRAAVAGYGRKLKLRSRASITRKEHTAALRAASRAFIRQNPRRRRRNPSALIVNPSRRYGMKRRRRNPAGLAGVAMQVAKVGGLAVGTAGALGALDVLIGDMVAKQGKTLPTIVPVLTRVGVGVAALIGLKNKPAWSVPIAVAAFAGIGQDLGRKWAGGIAGGGKQAATGEMAALAAEDEEAFGLLLTEMNGMGILQVSGVAEDAASAFNGTEPIEADAF